MEQQPAICHPETVPHLTSSSAEITTKSGTVRRYLGSQIDLRIVVVEEPLLSGERPNRDDAFKELSEVGENGAPCVRFHPTKISSCVQIADGKLTVDESDDNGGEYKQGEDDTIIIRKSACGTYHYEIDTHTTVMTDAAKLAREELTVCNVPDKDESTVSTSLLNRFNIRPVTNEAGQYKVPFANDYTYLEA